MNDVPSAPPPRAGMVAVVGAANAGKSSLINRILGEKVSIVSPVAQTTRNLVRGIHSEPRGQIVFLDTPGVHQAKKTLNQQMNKMARASTEGVDAVLLVIDRAEEPALEVDGWMRKLSRDAEAPVFFVLNKADQARDKSASIRELWAKVAAEREATTVPRWIETSAESGAGTEDLLTALFALMPVGPHLFSEDMISDFPRKLAIADVIREKYFLRLRQELPHSLAVCVERLDDSRGDVWTIEAQVYVKHHSQKGIVLGNKGNMMKSVRGESASEIAAIYGVRVKLDLNVKVMENWDQNFWLLRKLGYA
jgi:GTP-binding protein Era